MSEGVSVVRVVIQMDKTLPSRWYTDTTRHIVKEETYFGCCTFLVSLCSGISEFSTQDYCCVCAVLHVSSGYNTSVKIWWSTAYLHTRSLRSDSPARIKKASWFGNPVGFLNFKNDPERKTFELLNIRSWLHGTCMPKFDRLWCLNIYVCVYILALGA